LKKKLFLKKINLDRGIDRVIDRTFYPVPEARASNMRHRPIGLGIQGLANVFARLGIAYDSPAARVINLRIAETVYFAAVAESHALAVERRSGEASSSRICGTTHLRPTPSSPGRGRSSASV
jgi:ribonucleotide reductase alpha subunit